MASVAANTSHHHEQNDGVASQDHTISTKALGDRQQPLEEYLDNIEKEAILKALEKTRWNKTAAAKELGISFRALRYRLKKLNLDQELE